MPEKRDPSSRLRELERIWRQRLENAFERYCAAADEYRKLLQGEPGGCSPAELNRVLKAEAEALQEHSRILDTFTDLVLEGKLPQEADAVMEGPAATTITVVDDDEAIRDSTTMLLRSAGYSVATFASAESFLDSADLTKIDCLILDIRMPGMDGFELQRHLKSSQSRIPIIFLTARNDPGTRRRAIEEGAADFLVKPFEADTLVLAIESAQARAGMQARDSEMRSQKASAGDSPE